MKHLLKQGLDLAAAVSAAEKHTAADLTVAELVRGYNVAANSDFDWRLRKWVEAFGNLSAWELSSETIEIAAAAMLTAGYKPSTVNRDVSCLGTCYRWARRERLTPRGFRSPTLGVRRYNEGIRRVEVSPEEIAALRARSLTSADRRFGVFVHLLIDTGARRSELLERRWNEVDLKAGTIHCPTTKTGVQEHWDLIRHRAADYLMPDGPRVGGITPFLKVAQLAEHAGLMLAPHFAMELHIHLAATCKTEPWVEHFEWLERLFNERIHIREGRMQVPTLPGLGVSLSEQARRWTTANCEFKV